MTSIAKAWLAVAVGVTAAALVFAGETEQVQKRSGIVARLQVDRSEVALSGEIVVTISVEGPASLEIASIPAVTTSPAWRARRASPPATRPADGGRLHWQQTFILEPLQVKEVPLPIARIRFRSGPDAEWQEMAWKPFPIQVTTEIMSADLSELRDPTGVEHLPTGSAGPRLWPWLLTAGSVVLGGLALAGWWYFRRRPAAAQPTPPHEWALRELARLEDPCQPANGDVERYHALISDVVRRYLELRFAVRAPEQTTHEFLESLQRSSPVPPTEQELLKELFQRCDLAKFARASFTTDECQAVRQMAVSFIRETSEKPVRSPAFRRGSPAEAGTTNLPDET